jgi:NADPH:quinone reductase-like Zn-dependent oxidoreductase
MQAITVEHFGDANTLKLNEIPKPLPKIGEVLIKVEAAGINPLDVQTRRGDYSDYVSQPLQLGVEVSGTVEALGEGVDSISIGDEVYYSTRVLENEGGYAEYHTERAELIAKKPDSLSFAEAAAMPIAASTAWACLIERGRIKAGDQVLILGGSGGVGLYAIQIAHLSGAKITVTCREETNELVREYGADSTVDYRNADAWDELKQKQSDGFDAILDLVGGDSIEKSLSLLASGGRVVSIVDQPISQNLYSGWDVNAELHLVFLTPSADRLNRLTSLVDRGLLKPQLERILPLKDAAQAHELIESGRRSGKIVLSLSQM